MTYISCPVCRGGMPGMPCKCYKYLPHDTPVTPNLPVVPVTPTPIIPTGWVCPRCRSVLSPFVERCNCNSFQGISVTA